MPFIATNLTVLSAANGFTLWHYRTTDSKDQVQAPDYFAPASTQMRAGDIVMVQAADATLLLPIRAGNLTGSGLTLDAAGAPPELRRSGNLPFKITLAAAVQTRAIILDPMPEAFEAGASIPIGASILGNIANLTFQLLNAAGAILASQNPAERPGFLPPRHPAAGIASSPAMLPIRHIARPQRPSRLARRPGC
jgi:hypothetical protein